MKIKIGDKIYTTEEHGPLMVILSKQDKDNITRMLPECQRYCQFQETEHTIEEIEEFMLADGELYVE